MRWDCIGFPFLPKIGAWWPWRLEDMAASDAAWEVE